MAQELSNTQQLRDLWVKHNRRGEAFTAQQRYDEALVAHETGMGIIQRLLIHEPHNADWQQDMAAGHERIGDTLAALDRYEEALESYRSGLAVRERLAAWRPKHAPLQRDIAVMHNRVGDIFLILDQGEAALNAYRDGLTIIEQLVSLEPENIERQWDLSVSYNRMGDAQVEMGLSMDALMPTLGAGDSGAAGRAGWTKHRAANGSHRVLLENCPHQYRHPRGYVRDRRRFELGLDPVAAPPARVAPDAGTRGLDWRVSTGITRSAGAGGGAFHLAQVEPLEPTLAGILLASLLVSS